ncbi:GNAT family N-acetyltransferase [Gemmobacter nectariphilus]|uniref:GNAT family N-acetyltransferase n=1 Tax=Gemmobacter nectariphilus TaxID=220343 RepID=UPI00041A9EC8|nr:N-acetyltransferase [Gemmobacter nectariphilus]
MDIRNERPTDGAAIRALTTAAFATAPHSSGTEAAIVDALRTGGALHLSLVADEGGAILGHVAFSPVSLTPQAQGWFGLGPISVAPGHQRSGIGSALIRQGLAALRAQGAAGCVVLGDPRYYGRFGFVVGGLRYPGPPAAYFQALAFDGPVPDGLVSYDPAFGA